MFLRRWYDLLGVTLSLATDDAFVEERFSTLYGNFAAEEEEEEEEEEFRIRRAENGSQSLWEVSGGGLRQRYKTVRSALENIEAEICRRVLERRTDCVSLHAGTVVTDSGAALIVGPSGAGKSTLTVALAAQGWMVGGDDAALLDPAVNAVRPIPRCFHLDARSVELLHALDASLPLEPPEKRFLTPADFGMRKARPLQIETIIILSREAAPGAAWSPIPQAEAVACLAAESGHGNYSRFDALRFLGRMAGRARCYRVTRGDLGLTADRVSTLLRGEARGST